MGLRTEMTWKEDIQFEAVKLLTRVKAEVSGSQAAKETIAQVYSIIATEVRICYETSDKRKWLEND